MKQQINPNSRTRLVKVVAASRCRGVPELLLLRAARPPNALATLLRTHPSRFIAFIIVATLLSFTLHSALAQEKTDEELVKELSNPVASLISVPFQSNFEFKLGPNNDGFRYTLNFQPVVPISLTKDWNVIIRTIVPIIDQTDVIAPNTSQGGLSDITQSFFFHPRSPSPG